MIRKVTYIAQLLLLISFVSCGAPLEQLNKTEKSERRVAPNKQGGVGYEDYQSFESLDSISLPTRIDLQAQSLGFPGFELGSRFFSNPEEEIEVINDSSGKTVPIYITPGIRKGYLKINFGQSFDYGRNDIRVVLKKMDLTIDGSVTRGDFDFFYSSSSAVQHEITSSGSDGVSETYQGWINSGVSFIYSSTGPDGGAARVSIGDIMLQ